MFTLYDNNTFNGEKRGYYDNEHSSGWTGEVFNNDFAFASFEEAKAEAERLNATGNYKLEVVEIEPAYGLITKKSDIEIIVLDGKDKKEAKEFLNNGTTVYDGKEFERNFDNYMKDWDIKEDDYFYTDLKKMMATKEPSYKWNWSVVEAYGKFYYIQYAY